MTTTPRQRGCVPATCCTCGGQLTTDHSLTWVEDAYRFRHTDTTDCDPEDM